MKQVVVRFEHTLSLRSFIDYSFTRVWSARCKKNPKIKIPTPHSHTSLRVMDMVSAVSYTAVYRELVWPDLQTPRTK